MEHKAKAKELERLKKLLREKEANAEAANNQVKAIRKEIAKLSKKSV